MKAFVEAKVVEERSDFPSEDESSSEEEGEEDEDEDEEDEGTTIVVRGFHSDISDE
jgi:hypothetical protein